MQRRAIEELTRLLRDKLAVAEIPAAEMRGYVTPRRLAVIAEGIPAAQPDRSEERRGPRVGAPATAIDGFLRSAGLASVEQCEVRGTSRGEFYFATINRPGRPAAELLPELVKSVALRAAVAQIDALPGRFTAMDTAFDLGRCFCSRARFCPWPSTEFRSGEPLAAIVSWRPARFASPDAAEYLERLGKARVVVDQERRKEMIRKDLEAAAARAGVALKPDAGLLDEVTGLVEFPVVLVRRDRRRIHGASAGSAGNRDAHAPEIFFLPAIRRHAGAKISVCRQQYRRGSTARRLSRAMSAYCGPGSPMPAFFGTRTGASRSRAASRPCRSASFMRKLGSLL